MPYRLDITKRLHERLLDIVRVGLPLIASSMADADLAGLAHLRDEMVEAIAMYRRHVHALGDAAHCTSDPRRVADAEALTGSCHNLETAYTLFRERWACREGIENWHEYRLSAIVMMKQIRNHVQKAEGIRTANLAIAT